MWEVVALLVGTDFWDKNTERVHKHESTNRLKNSKTFFHFLVFILFSFILTKRRNSGVDSKKNFSLFKFLFLFEFFVYNYFLLRWIVKASTKQPQIEESNRNKRPSPSFFYFFSFCASVLLNTRNFFGSTVFLEIKVVPYRIESHCKIIVERNHTWREEATTNFIEDPSSQQPLPQLGLLNVLSELIPSTQGPWLVSY